MANYTMATGDKGLYNKTLVANTEDDVIIAAGSIDYTLPMLIVSDGAADLFYTYDGTTPTVNGSNCDYLPKGAIGQDYFRINPNNQLKLISSGTPTYSILRGEA